ncbi:hypothetical protein UFOVP1655_91 [uncultured Caudovirales phage]|uniref:Uncharacterized protein n=1 Tax=uncultured Caudovirales phage TaxID=2100421 RepID=A0A6J5T3U1_9CAUD|nr:hypothetical protein UFOVP1655_91 [uncultured Caudovirales phage]
MRNLLVNAIITPDGTRLESRHRHDYQTHIDANGDEYMIDGGLDYVRRSINKEPAIDDFVHDDDTHEVIRESFKWGTYGKKGDQPLVLIPLKSLDTEHIEAILETQTHLKSHIVKVFEDELEYRMI